MTLNLSIEFQAPVHHGTGLGVAGIVDRAFLRDSEGIPYLSGAAIKGKFRYGAIRIFRAREGKDRRCRPEDGQRCRTEPFCLFCKTFGSARIQGEAEFRDGFPEDVDRALIAEQVESSPSVLLSGPTFTRASTAISRITRTVEPEHLFSTEVADPKLRFTTTIEGPLSREQVRLLIDCAAILNHFGADFARGLGACQYRLMEATQ